MGLVSSFLSFFFCCCSLLSLSIYAVSGKISKVRARERAQPAEGDNEDSLWLFFCCVRAWGV